MPAASHERADKAGAHRRWALGLPETATEDDVRRAAFDRVQALNFVVDRGALDFVADLKLKAHSESDGARGVSFLWSNRPDFTDDCLSRIRTFAENYFQLAPQQRKAQWRSLEQECECSALARHRLAQLKSGLDLPDSLPESMSREAAELVRTLQSIYIASPIERYDLQARSFTPSRSGFEGEDRSDPRAEELCERFPEWRVLNPIVLDGLRFVEFTRRSLRRREFTGQISPTDGCRSERPRHPHFAFVERWGDALPKIVFSLIAFYVAMQIAVDWSDSLRHFLRRLFGARG